MISLVKSVRRQLEKDTGITIIRADTLGKVPPKPYATYKVSLDRGGVGREDVSYRPTDVTVYETRSIERNVVISFTVYGENVDNAVELTEQIRKWFDFYGSEFMESVNVAVVSVSNIQNRTTFLVDSFDEKFGFDVTLRYLVVDEREIGYFDTI